MLTDNELVKRLVRNPLITMDRNNITALAAERITDLLAEVERLRESAEWWERNATRWCADCKKAWLQRDLSAAKYEVAEAEVERLRRENDIMHHNVNEHLRVADKWKARFEGLIRDVSDLPSVPLDAPAEGRAILMEDISSMLAKLKKGVRCE